MGRTKLPRPIKPGQDSNVRFVPKADPPLHLSGPSMTRLIARYYRWRAYLHNVHHTADFKFFLVFFPLYRLLSQGCLLIFSVPTSKSRTRAGESLCLKETIEKRTKGPLTACVNARGDTGSFFAHPLIMRKNGNELSIMCFSSHGYVVIH